MNKTELFDFLTEKVATCKFSVGKQVYITSDELSSSLLLYHYVGKNVVCKGSDQLMPLCSHEEADSRS